MYDIIEIIEAMLTLNSRMLEASRTTNRLLLLGGTKMENTN